MKFGLHSVNLHSCGYPETAARLARAQKPQASSHCGSPTMWCCPIRPCRNARWPLTCDCSIPLSC